MSSSTSTKAQGRTALTVYSNNTVLDMDGDTIYSLNLPDKAAWISTGTLTNYYSNSQIASGAMWTADDIEQHVTSQLVALPPVTAPLPSFYPVPAGQAIQLEGDAGDPVTQTLSYSWDFGDGQTATGQQVSHLYSLPGTYTITMTVANEAEQQASQSCKVLYDPVGLNRAPVAQDAALSTRHDQSISSTAIATDADGDTLTFTVSGQPSHGSVTLNSSGAFTYTPASGFIGADSFTFAVRDAYGASDNGVISISVTNAAPVPAATAWSTLEDKSIAGSLSGSDGDGDALTFALAAAPLHGAAIVNSNGSFTYTPTANWSGTDSFTFTVGDPFCTSAPAVVMITVTPVNDPPTANDLTVATQENLPLTRVVTGQDVDGDPLSYRLIDNPTNGTINLLPNGSFTYVPGANWFGTDDFTFAAYDGTTLSAPAAVTIMVNAVNHTPVAQNLIVACDELGAAAAVTATDADFDYLTCAAINQPAHGTLTFDADGSFFYCPDDNYVGPDSFTFTASDGLATSSPATVTLRVNAANQAPVAQSLCVQTVNGSAQGADGE